MAVDFVGANLGTTTLTTCTKPVSNNSKSAWTEISASTPIDANEIILVSTHGDVSCDQLVDVGIGAAGQEVVVVSNIICEDNNDQANRSYQIRLPVVIRKGSRLAVRYQSSNSTGSLAAGAYLLSDTTYYATYSMSSNTYGAVTASSIGTQVDPGGSANTKGSYVELSSGITDDITHITVVASHNNRGVDTFVDSWFVDVATGPSGSETVVVPNVYLFAHTSMLTLSYGSLGPLPVNRIPRGGRISVRAQCDTTNATSRLINVQIIGWTASPDNHFRLSTRGVRPRLHI